MLLNTETNKKDVTVKIKISKSEDICQCRMREVTGTGFFSSFGGICGRFYKQIFQTTGAPRLSRQEAECQLDVLSLELTVLSVHGLSHSPVNNQCSYTRETKQKPKQLRSQ